MKYFFTFSVFLIALVSLLFPTQTLAATDHVNSYFRGTIMNIVREGNEDGDSYQDVRVRFESGEENGSEKELRILQTGGEKVSGVKPNDKVILIKTPLPNGETSFAVVDFYRIPRVMTLLGIFFLAIIIMVGKKRGILSLVGLTWSIVVLIFFIVPQIAKGQSPFWISVIGAFFIVLFSIFLSHGFNRRTIVASISTVITLVLSIVIGYLSILGTKSFGLGSENISVLLTSPIGELLNLRGLFLAGIIIGTLGVLDDVTTAQAAAVEEIHAANQTFSVKELYTRGMSVGREHIIALVNTLVLAYAGASLPVLLLFSVYTQPLWVTLSSEMIVEEIVRAISGSMSLLLAVPITTLLAAFAFSSKPKH